MSLHRLSAKTPKPKKIEIVYGCDGCWGTFRLVTVRPRMS
jgi:hypothetical protein